MKKLVILVLLVFNLFASNQCKELLTKESGKKKDREIFIIIDQTTPFSKQIRKNAIINILGIIKPRTMVDIFTFSEYSKGKSISLIDRYYFNANLTKDQRYDMSKKKLKYFDRCYKSQQYGLRKKVTTDILTNISDYQKKSKRSEIFYSLKQISKNAIKFSNAKEKIVILLSDMLENSSYTSFYGKKLEKLDIDKQLKIVEKNRLFGNFDGAEVIVIGAGIINNEDYRDGKDLDRLNDFWEEYFKKSNAKLEIFTRELKVSLDDKY